MKILRKLILEIANSDRSAIQMTYRESHMGAGIIVVKKFNTEWKTLVLFTNDGYDFPKGTAEPGESALYTALRETQEECGISDLNFQWGTGAIDLDGLKMYLASTTQEPTIKPNPKSGIIEHMGAKWVDWDEAANQIYLYLMPAIIWSKRRIEEHTQ